MVCQEEVSMMVKSGKTGKFSVRADGILSVQNGFNVADEVVVSHVSTFIYSDVHTSIDAQNRIVFSNGWGLLVGTLISGIDVCSSCNSDHMVAVLSRKMSLHEVETSTN